MDRRKAIMLAAMLVAGLAVLLLLVSFAYAHLLYFAPFGLKISWPLWLHAIPKLAFRTFGKRFLLPLLALLFFAAAMAAAFPALVRRRFQLFGAALASAASMTWVETLIQMMLMLSYQFSIPQDAVSASVSHVLAVVTHPWIAWPLIPALFAISGMLISMGVERYMKNGSE